MNEGCSKAEKHAYRAAYLKYSSYSFGLATMTVFHMLVEQHLCLSPDTTHETLMIRHLRVTFTGCPESHVQETQRCHTAASLRMPSSRDLPSRTLLHPKIPSQHQHSSSSVISPGYVQGEGLALGTPSCMSVLTVWSDACPPFLPSCDPRQAIAHVGTPGCWEVCLCGMQLCWIFSYSLTEM